MTSLVDWYNLEADKGILTPVGIGCVVFITVISAFIPSKMATDALPVY